MSLPVITKVVRAFLENKWKSPVKEFPRGGKWGYASITIPADLLQEIIANNSLRECFEYVEKQLPDDVFFESQVMQNLSGGSYTNDLLIICKSHEFSDENQICGFIPKKLIDYSNFQVKEK